MILKSLLSLIICFYFAPGTWNLLSLRLQLDQAANSKVLAEKFNDQFRNVNEKSLPILLGYKAISELVMCKHLINPISKLSHFRKGRNLLEIAIAASPKNPELSFFRFTTQSNVPALLNYKSDINTDKAVLINFLRSGGTKADPDLFKRIKNYMLSSKFCTAQEIRLIEGL
ncbi:MAG: hypothetical protein JWQ28_1913 [Pedobacter sp.]|jgi:hypothetical protein|nr:hypothetical protein [Pedobacter sp.]